MRARGCSDSTTGSTRLDVALAADTPLARSLERGYFARTFGHWETLGSGGYGTVLKAWHLTEEKWYAVKLISTRARACETIEDNHEEWSGPGVFKQLRSLKSPHVMRYFRYWSELPEDLQCLGDRSPLTCTSNWPSKSVQCLSTLNSLPSITGCSTVESDGGFEWAAAPPATGAAPGDLKSNRQATATTTNTASTPKQTLYPVVIMEQMEYSEGVTLAEWLKDPRRRSGLSDTSHDGVLELFSQVMKGLVDLHEVGIVHCDVKPANIMVTMPGAKIKFFDFGTARVRSRAGRRQGPRAPLSPSDQEGSCTALGTPGYAPPEHCMFPAASPFNRQLSESSLSLDSEGRGRVAGPGADIFSAGVVLVELLMVSIVQGRCAWSTAMERAEALAQVRSGGERALPLAVLRDSATEGWLRQLVLRMVVWDAEVRPSAREVLDELEAGLWVASRHNPNIGMSHPRSPQLAAMTCPFSAAHNPYIGYFLDHRRAGGI